MMKSALKKKIIKKEITILHFFLLATGKLFIGVAIGIMIAQYALPYSFPLLVLGAAILLPVLYSLFKEENEEDKILRKEIK